MHTGAIAEMRTGEGKTLTATLPVFLNTLAGNSVHLVTVNDYLARRDAEWMRPLYEALGVTVGVLQDADLPDHGDRRHAAYQADVTFGTNSEFGFDYLRDNMAPSLERTFQRDHRFAIVDEVDNILIDEARTPLIISGSPEAAADLYYTFARLAKSLDGVESKPKLKALGESKDTSEADYDYEYDEKHKTVAPTERGVEKAEKFLGVENLYLSEHGTLVNHLIQSLKAESLYRRDKDYAVVDGQVMIIDEFTGRILEGRRWSEGLHQAIEAKEGVAIREENQTLATITLQNYFRLYDKLSGMTGTALTEANEFMKIYKMPVVEIPTNRDMVRDDANDQIYKTKDGKWKAVVNEIEERNKSGQPILIGTVSVEVSEMLSEQFKRRGIEHVVLNAKPEHAQKEGETVAQAGRIGAVTIATNMAGRGVDIKLGGDPEMMAEGELRKLGVKPGDENYEEELAAMMPGLTERCRAEGDRVREAGGLFICGTERHESRRIDNQLRGRAGRQGDPGASRFFLSAQDDLVRLFAGDRIYKILDRLGPVDDDGEEYPLEAKMLSKQIENAQKKVEEQNYLSRKRVLEYDDVMNEQRRVVYRYRREILEGRDMGDSSREQVEGVVSRKVMEYTESDVFEEWDLGGLEIQLNTIWPVSVDLADLDPQNSSRETVIDLLDGGRAGRLRRARGGVRRRADARPRAAHPPADHRHAVEGAPPRDGLPARGHPPPRVRPDRSARRLQERGLHHVRGPDGLDLGGVRAADLPRRRRAPAGPGRGGLRRPATTSRRTSASPAGPRRPSPPPWPRRAPQPPPAAPRPPRQRPAATAPATARRRRPTPRRWSRRRTRRSAATIPAGAARARSTRSATAPDGP